MRLVTVSTHCFVILKAAVESTADSPDRRLGAVQRVVSSRAFNKSPRLSRFLTYVCEKTVEGAIDSINEQLVGVHVFGRQPGYNPADDNVVRSAARQLRQRLALFYQEEGRDEPVRILLPRGGYVPHFEFQDLTAVPEPTLENLPVEEHSGAPAKLTIPAASAAARFPPWKWVAAVAGLSMLLFAAWAGRAAWHDDSQTTRDAFWRLILAKTAPTLLVPCDSSFVMVQEVTKKNVHLGDYQRAHELAAAGLAPVDSFVQNNFSARKYTTMADVRLAANLGRLAAEKGTSVDIRFGRDIRVEDLMRGNAILVGGPQGNPWIELFARTANFSIETDDREYVQTVVNRAPQEGESAKYVVRHNLANRAVYPIYAIISFQPNLKQSGHVLMISGTSMAGIDAASSLLFVGSPAFDAILKEARRGDGSFRNFELLLTATNVSQNAVDLTIAAKRFGN